jgi:hypothetical protein
VRRASCQISAENIIGIVRPNKVRSLLNAAKYRTIIVRVITTACSRVSNLDEISIKRMANVLLYVANPTEKILQKIGDGNAPRVLLTANCPLS